MGKKIQLYMKAVELYKQKVKIWILFSILSIILSIFVIFLFFWIALMSEKALSCYCVLVISYFRNIEAVLFLRLNHQSLKCSVRCSEMMLRPFTMPPFLCELLHHCSVGIVLITFPVLPFPYSVHSIWLV
jgi:ABC-type amino acid transport system permease subunit